MEARLIQELPLSDDEYLKQAERFMAQAKKMNDAPIPYMIAAAFMNGDRAAALREEIATLRADLARERERHREMTELLREYEADCPYCYTIACPQECGLCFRTRALLEPQPAPAAQETK
jgi:hypothetical protein